MLCCRLDASHSPKNMTPIPHPLPFRARRKYSSFAALIAALLLTLFLIPAFAAPPPTPADTETMLTAARKQIDDIRKRVADETDDAALLQQRADALDIQSKADAAAEALAPQLASVAAKLSELGTPPEGAKEAPDVAAQRTQLEKSNRALDAQIKLARLLSVDAGQAAEQISAQRRTQFQARLGERRDSFLSDPFWTEFREEFPRDLERLEALGDNLSAAVKQTPKWGWLLLSAAAVLAIALRIWIGRLLLRVTATRVPPGRLRRSFLAVTHVALAVATPGVIALLIHIGLDWNSQLTDNTASLLANLVATVCFGGYVSGLGYALLSSNRPSWRLPPISDIVATRLRWLPGVLGVLVVMIWLAERLPVLLNASLTTTITLTGIVAVMTMAMIGAVLAISRRLRRQAMQETDTPIPFWLSLLLSAIWTVLILSLASLLAGYVAFGSFLVKQVLWTLIVLASAYLASTLIEDGFGTLLGTSHRDGSEHEAPSMRDQAAVLLSGVGRVAVGLLAITLLLAPFGEAPMDLPQRFDQLRKGLAIGEAQIRPGAVLQALLVLGLSLLSVKVLKRWLSNRYLPTTELDPGMQLSAATLFGYAGVVLAVALSLSAAGIGLERVAWIASALSVGIGFGLQAVVQNFVSGLILLAERPVKVGDWVSLGGVEGDILRINVRATEIQMGDRSTVIVPNSEFVTKTVRNVTRSNPLGLVQIKMPLPLSTDAEQVRELILQAFADHEDVLETPVPNVFLDGIEGGNLIFNAKGYVSSPRAAYGVRSALLFTVLKRLHDAGLEVSSPPTMLLASVPQLPSVPEAAPTAVPPPAGS
ncbi:Mechanosensitive ion channel [compost metagenome]